MISEALDTEGTGLDLRHGARPFFFTMCNQDDELTYWEWEVDPLTRMPIVVEDDLDEIEERINRADRLVLQNTVYDAVSLGTVRRRLIDNFPWNKVDDTLIGGHILASNQPLNLTTQVLVRLGINIKPLEEKLKASCQAARHYAKKKFPNWKLAKEDMEGMPSAKSSADAKNKEKKGKADESCWAYDMWVPRAIAKWEWESSTAYDFLKNKVRLTPVALKLVSTMPGWDWRPPDNRYEGHHPWWTDLRDYSNADSATTLPLSNEQLRLIEERGLTKIYKYRLKLLPVKYNMEEFGVTVIKSNLDQKMEQFEREAAENEKECYAIAKKHKFDLVLPKGANNNSLKEFVFDVLKLEPLKKGKSGAPSLDKHYIEHIQATHNPATDGYKFVTNLRGKRQRNTACSYMRSYKKFWLPTGIYNDKGEQLWMRLHPHLNPTGSDTLRWTCTNPNEQNISKKKEFNIRYCFGPAPGREWWSLDAQNIELRIPAYEAGETAMIELFERPNDPPYFGSNHLLIAHILHPSKFEDGCSCRKCGHEIRTASSSEKLEEWCRCKVSDPMLDGRIFKERYDSTWYQWTKNGNFAVQYGAQESSGTADLAYHIPGAQARIQEKLAMIQQLNLRQIAFAEEHGYVETIPDIEVDPEHGYPLLCTRTGWGKIKPTVPLSYHIQGTAMWWMGKAMVRTNAFLNQLNTSESEFRNVMGRAKRSIEEAGYHITMQIHDEIVFDFPRGYGKEPWKTNLPIIKQCQTLMAMGGIDIGIPTPVSIKYHSDNWAVGKGVS